MVLSDLGASVIKVEKPGMGDETRTWGPPFVGSESCYFLGINRNKSSLAVDLKTPEGVDILKSLAAQCDVFMENFVPGSLARVGLSYDDLQASCPGLIYCSLTGYGPTGPYSKRPGYDVMAASIGGLMSVTGPAQGPPCKVGIAMTDLATALFAHGAIMAALIERSKTGRGQKIDCDLLSTQVACMTNLASSYLNGNVEGKPYGSAHASIVPYQAFQTKDGYISVAGNNNEQFSSLCHNMDLSYLLTCNKFSDNSSRVRHRDELLPVLEKRFLELTTGDWLERFEGATFPYAPVNTLSQTFADPQVVHKEMVQTIDHPSIGPIKLLAPPVQFSESVNQIRSHPPRLGEHTRTILTELLKYEPHFIEDLARRKIVQLCDD
ncbi:hypothetical protein HAZT_HAZT000463 [Hyalella azteca]|nr:hypothetical protein HAZT_HAZT000463 [Hyalella azteca]